jgi:hypothetical protein
MESEECGKEGRREGGKEGKGLLSNSEKPKISGASKNSASPAYRPLR